MNDLDVLRNAGRPAQLAVLDLPAPGALTQRPLDWAPTGPDLLTDLRAMDHDAT